jgi:hypothetical protein
MAVNAWDTYSLIELIESRKGPQNYFTRRYFNEIMTFASEEVHFDEVLGERRMAPFVSPVVEGRVMRVRGSTMKSFRPAYVKPKFAVRPTEVLKRRPGESFGGSLSPAQRFELAKAQALMDQDEMIDNRVEWMIMEILKNGTLTVSGDDYPTSVVDYGRSAGNTITLVGTELWSNIASHPYDSLEAANTAAMNADHGGPVTDVYMNGTTYAVLKNHADSKGTNGLLDTNLRGSNTTINRDPMMISDEMEPFVVGTTGIFTLYIDPRQYENDAGSIVPYLTDGQVLMTSAAVRGVQGYGAIMDNDMLAAVRSFPKLWKNEDPSVTYAMTQSAPLPIAKRINASLLMNVL